MRLHRCEWVRVHESKGWDTTREEKRKVAQTRKEYSRDWVRVEESQGWDKKIEENWRVGGIGKEDSYGRGRVQ